MEVLVESIFSIDECPLPEIQVRTIAGKTAYIFENHKYAIFPWAILCRQEKKAIDLVTFDRHTDTKMPFQENYLRFDKPKDNKDYSEKLFNEYLENKLQEIDSENFENFLSGNLFHQLKNDEHILLARRLGLLGNVLVICHSADTVPDDEKVTIKGNYYDIDDNNLKTLNTLLTKAHIEKPYILDIDLDYFISYDKLSNEKSFTTFKRIIEGATAITIATEPEYVYYNREEYGSLDLESDKLLENLINLMNT